MGEREVCYFVQQVCSGLKYLASENVVHMDLKPENLVVSQRGAVKENQIKIIDFGLAKRIDPSDNFCCLNGTMGYMAPEQISFEKITHKTDLWAVGCVTYEMLSGYMAFDTENDLEFTRKVTKNDWTMDLGEENPFDDVSDESKDCFEHPWFQKNLVKAELDIGEKVLDAEKTRPSTAANRMKALLHVQRKLRRVQARRRWKRAIKTVKATVRMRLLIRQDPIDEIPVEVQNSILKSIISNWLGEDFDLETEMRSIYEENYKN